MAAKIKKGDRVIMLAGKDKGKTGEITNVVPEKSRVTVQGINIVKKHVKPSRTSQGGIVPQEASVHISNVALVDPKEDKPTRVGFGKDDDGKKIRIAKKSGSKIV